MSHLFISYARKDTEFAQKVVDALAANDLDTWIDWKSIPKGEDWVREINRGIEEADAFLFPISPDSVTADGCNKEIAHAVKNGKRILPIVIRDADSKIIHPEISKRNGRIAGYASLDGVNFFGFTYAGGVFSPLPPSAVAVSALNLNDAGTIVGNTSDDPNPDRAFILNGTIYSFFTRPGYVDPYARAISQSGLVTGYSADAAGATAGFIYNPFTGLFTDISPAGSNFTIAQGINNAGQVVGSANLPALGGQHGWLRQPDGTINTFRIAGSPTRPAASTIRASSRVSSRSAAPTAASWPTRPATTCCTCRDRARRSANRSTTPGR